MKKAAFAACSNGLAENEQAAVNQLKAILYDMGIETTESPYLYSHNGFVSGSAQERADVLNSFYRDNTVDAIFDLSGGDMANELLPYLDFELIGKSKKIFYGYSDLTTIINAIYAKTGRSSMLFQIKTLVWDKTGIQQARFRDYLAGGQRLQAANWILLQGSGEALLEHNIVLGGNVRCFLKLAGTPYFPNLNGKILFLESYGGSIPQISTYMAQLYQLGVFEKIKAILLGTFIEMEQKHCLSEVYRILKQYLPKDMPVAQTADIGHGKQSAALEIGSKWIVDCQWLHWEQKGLFLNTGGR